MEVTRQPSSARAARFIANVRQVGPLAHGGIRAAVAFTPVKADGTRLPAREVAINGEVVNDIVAVTAFIGSIFGAGGGAEASNAEFLSKLQNGLGADTGRKAWEDAMLFGDPEAPTTITRTFNYGHLTGGQVQPPVAGSDERRSP